MTAAERPEGIVTTLDVSIEPAEAYGWWVIHWPSGKRSDWSTADLEFHGIPLPRPPRVGPLGLSEEDTRWWANAKAGSLDEGLFPPGARLQRAIVLACRDTVAAWDAS